MKEGNEEIAKTFRDYAQAFQRLQPSAAAAYCQTPCLFISAAGVRLMASTKDAEDFIDQLMASLKTRAYSRSKIIDMKVNRMTENLALVSVQRVRYRADGSELERVGESYTMRKADGAWKIAAAMAHEPDAILVLA